MAESWEEIENATDALVDSGRPVKRWKNRKNEVEYQTGKDLLDTIKAKAMLRGLQSSRRGLSLGKIQDGSG